MSKMTVSSITKCAMFAAMSAVLSQVMIPIGPVPVTLTHISVFLAAGLLGAKPAAISQIVFVLMGAVGLPVFAGFKGGLGALFGETGGFIIGYVFCAYITGAIIASGGMKIRILFSAMVCGMAASYSMGILWYMHITNSPASVAVAACIIPFLPGDFLKICTCVGLLPRLSRTLSANR